MATAGCFRPPVQRAQVATDAAGNAVWTFPQAFTGPPRVVFSLGPSADAALVEGRITALSATQVTVNVRRAPAVTLLGLAVLSAPQPAVGVAVQLYAVTP